jgi:hypothetical protein
MKQTGARWRVRRANRMATLCCTLHGDTWGGYWKHCSTNSRNLRMHPDPGQNGVFLAGERTCDYNNSPTCQLPGGETQQPQFTPEI